ncbi:MAG TPA: glutamine synthetase family protein [Candidatus Sulfotelmatobacter sp.]|jgi:glutamine synthetase|nr:glutamine synthetase family protein [Candidatus Sulfotelmatobacter sp.]
MKPAAAAVEEEAEVFLAAHPEIVAFDLVLIDANGIARGKIVRRHELLPIFKDGRHLPGSILGLDVWGEDVEETGLVWSDGDADRRAWPIAGSLTALPWTSPPRGQVQLSLHELDGRPVTADPRHALTRQDDLLRAQGMNPVAAFELEFYLLERGPDGQPPLPARLPLTGERPAGIQVYRVEELDRLEPFIDEVYRAAEVLGLPLETMISEYGCGQYELTLHHRPSILQAADDLIRLKRMLRAIAARRGMLACFMAKPYADQAGSGMHIHASLTDRTGANLFADIADGQLAPLLTQAVAGLLETMEESLLVFAPHANSWRRFAAQSYAPLSPNWGVNNRSVAVRVPAGATKGRHLEQRAAGVDANPYLVGAVVLAAMRRGIAKAAVPGPAAEGNGYAAPDPLTLPPDWRSAILRAAASPFLKDALGERMLAVLTALKRAEYRRFANEIPTFEYQTYLETV